MAAGANRPAGSTRQDHVPAWPPLVGACLMYRVLEPRTVFDAAVLAVADAVTGDAQDHSVPPSDPAPPPDGASHLAAAAAALSAGAAPAVPAAIAFVDGAVADLAGLIAAIGPDCDVVVLDPAQDGVIAIAAALAERRGIDAIHFQSHGEPGRLELGTAVLTAASVSDTYAGEMAIIRAALSDTADILIYGCNAASGSAGRALAAALSTSTGADIAASTDDTGAASRGGDWVLEHRTGPVGTSALAPAVYSALLSALDADGDGVADATDIDRDNDGILDINESLAQSASHPDLSAVVVAGQAYARGSHVQIGIGAGGTFGAAAASIPSGFADIVGDGRVRNGMLGIIADSDRNGFASGGYDGDFFTPGLPEEGFSVRIAGSDYSNNTSGSLHQIAGAITGVTVSATAAIEWSGFVAGLQVDRTVTLPGDGLFIRMQTTLTNTTATALHDIYWLHTVDPDNDASAGAGFATLNTIVAQVASSPDLLAMVTAEQTATGAGVAGGGEAAGSSISLLSYDARAKVSYGGFANRDGAAIYNGVGVTTATGSSAAADRAISIAFDVGTLAPGQVTSIVYYYKLGAGPAPLSDIRTLEQGDDADGDGLPNALDLDSDDDGIPDNVEAQATGTYIAPSGLDQDEDGLDDAYDRDVGDTTAVASAGLLPVNSDAGDRPDFVDADSDNDGLPDRQENGFAVPPPGPLAPDTDADGIKDVYESARGSRVDDGFDPNDAIVHPLDGLLPDEFDAARAIPLSADLDFRDAIADDAQPALLLAAPARDHAVVYVENSSPVAVAFAATAIDREDNIVALSILPTGLRDGAAEILTIGGGNIRLDAASTHVATVGSTSFHVGYATATGILITSAAGVGTPMSTTGLAALLRTMTYANASENPAAGVRVLSMVATDAAGSHSPPAIATIAVVPVNDAPLGADAVIAIDEDHGAIGILPALSDPENDGATYTLSAVPRHGTVVVASDGGYVYRPAPNFNGQDEFSYTATDGQGEASVYWVRISVAPVDDAPLLPAVMAAPSVVRDGQPVTIELLADAHDADGDRLYVAAVKVDWGSVEIIDERHIAYRPPAAGAAGLATITYVVSDEHGNIATGLLTIEVEPSAQGAPGDVAALTAALFGHSAFEPLAFAAGPAGNVVMSAVSALLDADRVPQIVFASDVAYPALMPIDRIAALDRLVADNGLEWAIDVDGLSGYALRIADRAATSGQLAIETLVRERLLILNVTNTYLPPGREVASLLVAQRDGRPLPDWLAETTGGLYIGRPPAGLDELHLRIEVLFADSKREVYEIRITVKSGEIAVIPSKRAEHFPRLITDQLRADHVLTREDGRRLALALVLAR